VKRLWSNKPQLLAVVGGVMAIASIGFEYARNKPDFGFLVFPWSIRGYELAQGWTMAILGVGLIVAALIDSDERPLMWVRRFHMLAAVATWLYITFSAGSLRSALIDKQLATPQIPSSGEPFTGIATPYKDVQITSGWLIAVTGAVVIFLGAVGMWATRRDQRKAQLRAADQRAAAEQSARELEQTPA